MFSVVDSEKYQEKLGGRLDAKLVSEVPRKLAKSMSLVA